MNLIEKIISYIELRNGGFSHQVAKQEFKRNPITFEDKIVLWFLVAVAIAVAFLLYQKHQYEQIQAVQEQHRISEHKRMLAKQKAQKYEQIIIATLNGGTVRIDGVTRRVCVKDTNGDCL